MSDTVFFDKFIFKYKLIIIMSEFNFNEMKNATISLSNNEKFNFKKLSISVNGKIVVKEKKVSTKIEDGVLIIETK